MSEMDGREGIRIALAGNPNSGKTTLFNSLTGAHHKVGNYPGVTVEKLEGSRFRDGREYRFIDLPGIYSLTAYSIDEVVARDFLLDEPPDLIVDVIDSGNLERHLYLCLQFQELGIPVIGALNMSDEAEAKGVRIDEMALGGILGIPMIKTVGSKGQGIEGLLDAIEAIMDTPGAMEVQKDRALDYGKEIEERISRLERSIREDSVFSARYPARWLATKLLEKDANAAKLLREHSLRDRIAAETADAIAWIEMHFGKDSEIVVSEQRYGYIRGAVREAVTIVRKPDFSVTEAVDKVIMNRFLALPVLVGVMWATFQLTFALGEYPMAWLEALFSMLSGALTQAIPDGLVRSLLVDGIVGGVGGVLSFVPLIVILFFILSMLEDSGYMSRAAFASDRLLHAFGLHGQSVLPLILGFGCSVPAIMAARALKSPRDRIITILVIPFMSCGAKLPVYVLLSGAFFPENPAGATMAIYAIGVALSLVSALVLRRTVLAGNPTPFVMELPPYRMPTLKGVLWHVWDKTWQYVKKAGTVILAASLFIWAVTSFPSYEAGADAAAVELAIERSYAGQMGKFIEPVFRPLGFDWKIGVATITGFAAKEVVVSTLGILYRVGSEEGIGKALATDPDFTPLVAFTLMVFILVIPPCFAALAVIRSEIGWKWLAFSIVSMLILGWSLAFSVYRIGSLLGA